MTPGPVNDPVVIPVVVVVVVAVIVVVVRDVVVVVGKSCGPRNPVKGGVIFYSLHFC